MQLGKRKQEDLENRILQLHSKNLQLINENKHLLKNVKKKTEYTKRLENLFILILDQYMAGPNQQSHLNKLNNLENINSNNPHSNFLDSVTRNAIYNNSNINSYNNIYNYSNSKNKNYRSFFEKIRDKAFNERNFTASLNHNLNFNNNHNYNFGSNLLMLKPMEQLGGLNVKNNKYSNSFNNSKFKNADKNDNYNFSEHYQEFSNKLIEETSERYDKDNSNYYNPNYSRSPINSPKINYAGISSINSIDNDASLYNNFNQSVKNDNLDFLRLNSKFNLNSGFSSPRTYYAEAFNTLSDEYNNNTTTSLNNNNNNVTTAANNANNSNSNLTPNNENSAYNVSSNNNDVQSSVNYNERQDEFSELLKNNSFNKEYKDYNELSIFDANEEGMNGGCFTNYEYQERRRSNA